MMMKKSLMAAAALAAFVLPGIANAADLAVPPAPPVFVPAPVLSWTGAYVGLNGGGGWGTTAHTFTGVAAGLSASTGNFKTSGGVAGGTWGYNYQIGAWVFGAESDLDWANIRGTFTATIPGVIAGSLSTKLNWLSTYRARVGYTWGQSMLYATGGAAVGNITATAAGTVPAVPATGSTSQSNTELGWTAGAGFEYMFMPHLTGKIEYLYVNLPSTTLIFVDSVKFNTSIVRAGVNWKF
jgi:outer membrane immunogenic protein